MSIKGKVRFINKDKTLFFPTLKKRVDLYFKENKISKNANGKMVFKTIVLLALYLTPFILILTVPMPTWTQMCLWVLMGIGLAGVGMSIMHDANHEAYSNSKTVNFLLGSSLNLLGGSIFNWKLQHNVMHHTYTNIAEMDDDVDDKLVLRFNPHTQVKWYHKMQWLYAFLFYGILTLYWVVLKDFVQFAKYTKEGVNENTRMQNVWTMTRIILSKLAYYFVVFFVPFYWLGFEPFPYILGWLLMHFVAGNILTITFQLAHTVEGTTHPLPNESGVIENDWAIHQMNTTVNFSRKSKLISWYVGGLNFQVEHHLFPYISHVHYPAISEIVKSTAKEFNVPYLENETLGDALKSHISALQKFGKLQLPNINEALAG
jgi:linoleoyl-CoA desaturase